MYTYTKYNATTGEIAGTLETSGEVFDIDGVSFIAGDYDRDNYYMVGTTPTAKTANPATISGQTISNIHNPSTVDCGELGSYEVTDGEFEFTIDTPGTYDITVISVPHFDETFTVTIV